MLALASYKRTNTTSLRCLAINSRNSAINSRCLSHRECRLCLLHQFRQRLVLRQDVKCVQRLEAWAGVEAFATEMQKLCFQEFNAVFTRPIEQGLYFTDLLLVALHLVELVGNLPPCFFMRDASVHEELHRSIDCLAEEFNVSLSKHKFRFAWK